MMEIDRNTEYWFLYYLIKYKSIGSQLKLNTNVITN